MPSLNKRLLEILQHALGLDEYGRGESHRNHFCAGGDDVADCAELVALGYMRSWRSQHYPYFNCAVTELGRAAVLRESPQPPKLSRSQKRYRAWLNVADVYPDWSFGDWLRYKQEVLKDA
jgi:hypothetical protein